MRVAFPTEDGKTISAHLGRAPFYLIAEYEDGQAPRFEQREKAYHDGERQHEGQSHMSHAQAMFQAIRDCQVLISGGMGQPAYEQAIQQGLQVILTGEKDIAAALEAYRAGTLVNDPSRVHIHH